MAIVGEKEVGRGEGLGWRRDSRKKGEEQRRGRKKREEERRGEQKTYSNKEYR